MPLAYFEVNVTGTGPELRKWTGWTGLAEKNRVGAQT